jgi:mono/diheme cytochrome c family protein
MTQAHLKVRCPHCRFRFKVEQKYAGRVARCPKTECGGKLRIPQPKPLEASQVDPAMHSAARPDEPVTVEGRKASKNPVTSSRRTVQQPAQAKPAAPLTTRQSVRRPDRNAPPRNRQATKTKRGIRIWQLVTGTVGILLAGLAILFAPNGDANPRNEVVAGVKNQEVADTGPDIFKEKLQPFVTQYCADCHNADDPEAGVDFAAFPTESSMLTGHGRKTWEKILAMLEIGAMPPADMEQPSAALREELTAWLEDKLFNLDCELIDDPGRVTVRRLNRVEYRNTIRDLLAVDFDPTNDFPSDDVGYGFDNIGDVLSLSPLLMEKYLDAAETITAEAIPVVTSRDLRTTFETNRLRSQPKTGQAGGFLTLSSRADIWVDYQAPLDGEYEIDVRAKANQFGNEPAKMELRVDGKVVRTFDVTGEMRQDDYIHKMRLDAGQRKVQVSFINDEYVAKKGDRNLFVGRFAITRPADRAKVNQFIRHWPEQDGGVRESATAVLTPFIKRAFRGPVSNDDVSRFVDIVEMTTNDGEVFEQGIQYAVQAVLVSPSFLFRVETDTRPDDPMAERPVTDFELASRLSYFLWSSMPDEELFHLAERGELRKPDVLKQQVVRLLGDPKSRALVDNFAGQWLNLAMLDEMTPDPNVYPNFDVALRDDMKQESLLLFETIMREDRSLLEFLDADFTFMNERLARHYGKDGVKGDQFQKVSLDAGRRAGILTHASILTLTSNPERTSPVKRGKWIMENILGESPPPPPPGVPELEETTKNNPDFTLREQLKLHRADPGCASCHRTMDVLGFGFENFDATGRWRDKDGNHAIDPAGELPGGDSFAGPTELVRLLKNRRVDFARCLSEKMLTYALGRGLEYYDRCATNAILKQLDASNYRFSELVLGIVTSKPFQKRRGDGERE